jgi:hypothetical protein
MENAMARPIQVWTGIVAALLSFATVAQGQQDDFPPEDKAIIRDYVLTVDKFEGFIDGLITLAAAKNSDVALALELDEIDREPAETLADLRAQVTGHPRVFEFYQDQGLTADDTVLIPLVAGYAAAATEPDDPVWYADRISSAQVNFMRENSTLMDRLVDAYAVLYAAQ